MAPDGKDKLTSGTPAVFIGGPCTACSRLCEPEVRVFKPPMLPSQGQGPPIRIVCLPMAATVRRTTVEGPAWAARQETPASETPRSVPRSLSARDCRRCQVQRWDKPDIDESHRQVGLAQVWQYLISVGRVRMARLSTLGVSCIVGMPKGNDHYQHKEMTSNDAQQVQRLPRLAQQGRRLNCIFLHFIYYYVRPHTQTAQSRSSHS
jgi:hypothetical protein